MTKEYVAMSTHPLNGCRQFVQPEELPELVHVDDPALNVLIDFQHVKPLIAETHQRLYDARVPMENSELHVTLVVDEEDCLIGIITLEEILGAKPIRLQEELRIERKKLRVKHMLIPLEKLSAVDYGDLRPARVGHIIETLHQLNQHYLLVCETNEQGEQTVRGVFLTGQISKQLGTNVLSSSKPLSAVDLQEKIARS